MKSAPRTRVCYIYIAFITLLFLLSIFILRSGRTEVPEEVSYSTAERESENTLAVLRYIEDGYNGRDEEVIRAALAADFVQHAPYIPDGVEGFIRFYREQVEMRPDMYMHIHRVFAEDSFVVLHSHLLFDKDDFGDDFAEGLALIDLYRLDDDARIAEYWGLAQSLNPSVTSANGNSLFDGYVNKRTDFVNFFRSVRDTGNPNWMEIARGFGANISSEQRDMNKEVVREYSRLLFDEGDFEKTRLRELVADDMIQHNPSMDNGPGSLIEAVRLLKQEVPDIVADIRRVVTDGDFVVTQVHYRTPDITDDTHGLYSFDIHRVVGGKIVEHWGVVTNLTAIQLRRVKENTNSVF